MTKNPGEVTMVPLSAEGSFYPRHIGHPVHGAGSSGTASSERNVLWEESVFMELVKSALSGSASVVATRHDCPADKLVKCAFDVASHAFEAMERRALLPNGKKA